MEWTLSLAREQDIPALEQLIPISARKLLAAHYSPEQIDAALGPVFGVDRQLIRDGTYFVARHRDAVIACGGWSKRVALFGGDAITRPSRERLLDPASEPARIRAFFVHPDWTRRGIGRAMLEASEAAMLKAQYHRVELSATLGGEPLYAAFGYKVVERYEIKMPQGLTLPVVKMSKSFLGATAPGQRPLRGA